MATGVETMLKIAYKLMAGHTRSPGAQSLLVLQDGQAEGEED